MSFEAHVLRVLIASPSDTTEERDAVESSLGDWNVSRAESTQVILLPWLWEKHAVPLMGDSAQSIINSQAVDDADLVIALFDSRLGQETEVARSGTEEEIIRADAGGKPVHVYFSKEPIPRDADPEQLAALKEFRASLEQHGLVGEYATPGDLGYQVRQAIDHDVERLGLVTPAVRRDEPLVRLRARYLHESLPNGTDTKGKPKFKTISRLVVRNSGTVTAEGVILAVSSMQGDHFRFDGPTAPFDLLPDSDRNWMFVPLGGILDEVDVHYKWFRDGEEYEETQTISL